MTFLLEEGPSYFMVRPFFGIQSRGWMGGWIFLRLPRFGAIGAIGASMNRVRQPHTLLVLGLNSEMGTTAGAERSDLPLEPYRGTSLMR